MGYGGWVRQIRTAARASLLALSTVGAQAEFPPSLWLDFEEVVSGPAELTDVQNAADGSGRLFLVEQRGRILILKNGQVLEKPFLDLSDRGWFRGEDGLLGLAFPPDFATKRHFYIYYRFKTDLNPGHPVRLSRFRLNADPDRADPDSEEVLLEFEGGGANHFGGQLAFGPNDGYLYVAVGDREKADHAQDLAVLPGKILRIDTESPLPPGHAGPPYLIPASNPHVGQQDVREEILFAGLRNAWRFSFDSVSGDLFISDVGERNREEINVVPANEIDAGANFGWPFREGTVEWTDPGAVGPLTAPVFDYERDLGTCVIGGHCYRGADLRLQGLYILGDWGSGRYWVMKREGGGWVQQALQVDPLRPRSFGCDEDGELYMLSGVTVYRVRAPAYAAPPLIESRVFSRMDSARITMATRTPEGEIRYTIDGSEPTKNSTVYEPGETLVLTEPGLLRARTFNADLSPSAIAEERIALRAAGPVIDPPGGTMSNPFTATLSSDAGEGVIRFTLDGTDPDESSPIYAGEVIPITRTTELRATVFRDGWLPSFASSAEYRLVTRSPVPRNWQPDIYEPIDLASLTEGATFHYTLDGAYPDTSSPVWSEPLMIPAGTTLRAIAVKPPLETGSPTRWRVERVSAAGAHIVPLAGGGSLANLHDVIDPFDGMLFTARDIAVAESTVWISALNFGERRRLWQLSDGQLVLRQERSGGAPYQGLGIGQGTELWGVDPNSDRAVRFTSPRISSDQVVYGQGSFQRPRDLSVLPDGRVLVVDSMADKIWELQPDAGPGGTITTFAGSGEFGSEDGPAQSATFAVPLALVHDGHGTVYVADGGSHSTASRIRKIDPSGVVSTFADSGGRASRDGPIDMAEFDSILALAADVIGNVYVAQQDWGIRKISPDGWVSSFQGALFANDGTTVQEPDYRPIARGLDVDSSGVLHFVDSARAYRLKQDDWDNDHIPDFEEPNFPACTVGVDDRTVDADGDGHSNAVEVAAGSDPEGADDLPAPSGVRERAGGGFRIWFPTVPGQRYHLEFSDNGTDWIEMGVPVSATLESVLFSARIDPTVQPRRFYRLRELP